MLQKKSKKIEDNASSTVAAAICAGNVLLQKKLTIGEANDPLEHEADAMANTVMRMPESSIQRKCAHCEEEAKAQLKPLSSFIQKKESPDNTIVSDTVQSKIELIKGGGEHLHDSTRSFMESRFGTDFSQVRIHSGDDATSLSIELNAQAFTVGRDIYFNAGKYQPHSFEGKQLLAHELTHTLQQNNASSKLLRSVSCDGSPTAPARAPQGTDRNTIDARARAIIDIASGSDPVATKAVNIVTTIICQYYPAQAATVDNVIHDPNLASGLETQSAGSGATSTGTIRVSNQFVADTTAAGIARRVLQVGHELQHIQQYRSGMGGHNKRKQREFLAFTDESLGDEFAGTGRMQYSTRLGLIDEALRNYFCLDATLQSQYASQLATLRTRRQAIIATGRVSTPGPEPTTCPT